jgi:cytochrome c2
MKHAGRLVLIASCALAGGCKADRPRLAGGDAARGADVIQHVACGSCHVIPGIRAAHGLVGPPLEVFSRRTYIAGQLPNTPANLARWLRAPQDIEPRTAMPNLGLTDGQARDAAAYLYTLR